MKKEFSYFCYYALTLEASKFQCNTLYHFHASSSFTTKRANNTWYIHTTQTQRCPRKKSQKCTKNSESSSCCLGSAHWDAPIFQMFFRHDIQQQKYELTYHSNVMRTKPIPIHTHLVILSVFCKQKHRFWCFSAPPLVFKNRSSYLRVLNGVCAVQIFNSGQASAHTLRQWVTDGFGLNHNTCGNRIDRKSMIAAKRRVPSSIA